MSCNAARRDWMWGRFDAPKPDQPDGGAAQFVIRCWAQQRPPIAVFEGKELGDAWMGGAVQGELVGFWLIGEGEAPGRSREGRRWDFCLEVGVLPIPLGCGGTFHSFSYLHLTGDFAPLDFRVLFLWAFLHFLLSQPYYLRVSRKRGSTKSGPFVCGILHRHRHRGSSTPTATNGDIHINSNRSTLFPGERQQRNIRSRQSHIYISPRGRDTTLPTSPPNLPSNPNHKRPPKATPTCLTNPSEP